MTIAPTNAQWTSNPSRRPTSWLTSLHGRHGGVFIAIVEWAREGTHRKEVEEFLDKHTKACERAEAANPILRKRQKKIRKAARRKAAAKNNGA